MLLICSSVVFSSLLSLNSKAKVDKSDLDRLLGNWNGSLTYLDYSSGEAFTMPANVSIVRIGETNNYVFLNSYPEEPDANSADTLVVSDDGRFLNNEKVIKKHKLSMGVIEIVTSENGKDGNDDKPATFRHTYSIGKTYFSKKKEVQFVGTSEWIIRHEYKYSK